jgi:hypothetical protein
VRFVGGKVQVANGMGGIEGIYANFSLMYLQQAVQAVTRDNERTGGKTKGPNGKGREHLLEKTFGGALILFLSGP